MTWSLATYRKNNDIDLGVLCPDGSLLAPPELRQWRDMLDLLTDWPHASGVLQDLSLQNAPAIAADEVLSPLRWPRKVLCAGVNYRKHIREMGGEVPGSEWHAFFFLKPPTTTVIGPNDPILIHNSEQARYDWEAELAVVIGVGGRDISVEDALGHVAGYCVANDVTARGYHKRQAVPADAFIYDWFASKSIDSSLPLGPGVTPAFFVSDPQDLRLRLWLNDELQQDESTSDMICSIAEIVSTASSIVTLEPGDVIPTGTPSGVGASRGRYLRHGDTVRVAIDGLGEISNPVIESARRTT